MIINKRYEHPEKKRYYCIILAQDLFGDWVVTRVWGGIDAANGRIMHVPCASYDEALLTIENISKLRKQRGYQLCDNNCLSQ